METDLSLWRLGRSNELLDRFEDNREFLVVFLLERFDLARQVAVAVHQTAELYKGAHDCDIYLYGTRAAQHAGKHGDALLGKGIRAVAAATAAFL